MAARIGIEVAGSSHKEKITVEDCRQSARSGMTVATAEIPPSTHIQDPVKPPVCVGSTPAASATTLVTRRRTPPRWQ